MWIKCWPVTEICGQEIICPCVFVLVGIPQEKVEYNQQSLACYSKLLFFPKKLYWRRTSVIFQIILINKPNCLWDQHPSSNDLVYCVFFVAAAFSDGWQAGKVEAAVGSAGFQLLLCRSLFSWRLVGCPGLLGMFPTFLNLTISSNILASSNIKVFASSSPTLAKWRRPGFCF